MRRREFVALLGSAAALSLRPLPNRAQQRTIPTIGFLHSQSPDGYDEMVSAFPQGLKEQGFTVGQNVAIEYRWANNEAARIPALATELAHRPVAVIVAGGGAATAIAAKAATTTIPIVFANGADPVRQGLVASLNRPGGNVTGVTFITTELGSKRLGLLCELLPKAETIGYLTTEGPQLDAEDVTSNIVAAGRVLGRHIVIATAPSESEFEGAFASLVERGASAVLIGASPLIANYRAKLVALAAHHKLPAMYPDRVFAVDGGLISYGTSISANYRLAGVYAGRVLKGDKPADLPVQQSLRFELVVNLKTAKEQGLKVSDMMVAIADEVIE